MSPRRMILIGIALAVSALTTYLVFAWVQAEREAALEAQRHQAPPPPAPSAMVLVAKGDLSAGLFVRPENLRWQAWPNDGIAPTYVVQGQRALEDFIGAVVRSGMSDGEPISESRIVRPGDRGFLAAVLTPGNRAVAVTLSPSAAIAGFVFPGDHVDVIATIVVKSEGNDKSGQKDHENRVSETVLTDVRVLALDQRADDQNKEVVVAKTATLEVTPKQAEVVAVLGEVGKLSLSLRSLAHDEREAAADSMGTKLTYTFDSEATQLIQPPNGGSSRHRVEIVRGSEAKEIDFSGGSR